MFLVCCLNFFVEVLRWSSRSRARAIVHGNLVVTMIVLLLMIIVVMSSSVHKVTILIEELLLSQSMSVVEVLLMILPVIKLSSVVLLMIIIVHPCISLLVSLLRVRIIGVSGVYLSVFLFCYFFDLRLWPRSGP